MHKLRNNFTLLTIFILVIVGTTTFFGHQMISGNEVFGVLRPSAGFIVGILYVFRKRAFYTIGTTLLLTHILYFVLLTDYDIAEKLYLGFAYAVSDIVFMSFFVYIMDKFNPTGAITFKSTIQFVINVVVGSFVYAAVNTTLTFAVKDTVFIYNLMESFIGHFLGAYIIASPIILSNQYDSEEKDTVENILLAVLYLVLFAILLFVLFYDTGSHFNYDSYMFLILMVFILSAFRFSFRMMVFLSIIYISFSQIFRLQFYDIELVSLEALALHISLFSLITITTLVRLNFVVSERKSARLEQSQSEIDDMMESTFTLLRLGEQQQFQEEFDSLEYLKDLFNVVTKVFTNYDKAACYVKGEEFVNFLDAKGYDPEFLNNFKFRIEDFEWKKEIPEHVVESKRMVKQSLKNRYSKFIEREDELRESLKFCLFLEHNVVGGMSFDITQKSNKRFTKQDYEKIKSFQRIMNSFYQTRYLLSRNSSLRDEIVLSLIRTLELYDQYTGGHSEEVASLSQVLALRLGLSEQDAYDIFWAGIVHDIGKVGIPSDILNKPNRLSMEEYQYIKEHPIFGYDILSRSEDLKQIAKLVKHHHEWVNGAGYPDGLKGNQIPFGSRIISVADAVSAMATKRPYMESKTSKEILRELKLYKGSQFDPTVVDVMIDLIDEGFLDEFYLKKTSHK